MAMSIFWICILIISIVFGIFRNNSASVGAAALLGAQRGIELALSISGAICLWSGLARLMEASGLSERLTKFLRPLLKRLFPQASRDDAASHDLCGNLTANLLGLGNAATPMGIAAVRRMQVLSGTDRATDEMCRLIVLNTASVQLLPSTVAAVRASLGAAQPLDVLPAIWISSLFSVFCGLTAARLLQTRWKD